MIGRGHRGELVAVPGYRSEQYVRSLQALGTPARLEGAGTWAIRRPVPGSSAHDAMGPYPLLLCADWSGLRDDLRAMASDTVSFVAVLDPLGAHEAEDLSSTFPDLLRPFKEHYVVDLTQARVLPDNHRRNLRRGARSVEVEVCPDPQRWSDEWVRLYRCLRRRHGVRGFADFDAGALRAQLVVPGALVLRAEAAGCTVGMAIFYEHGTDAHYHLAAYDEEGYRTRASFPLFAVALEELRPRVRWLDLGGAAGTEVAAADGLARFKQGWSTGTRVARLGGVVLDPAWYQRLVAGRDQRWFPAYRGPDR